MKKGFTLIELSIVLVIIGLIVGGVLVGRDLIKAAEIRSTISQYEKLVSATKTFQLKYNGLPGDLANATSYGFTSAAPYATAVVLGDGLIQSTNNGTTEFSFGVGAEETTQFWRQLSVANLIDFPSIDPGAIYPGALTADQLPNYFPSAKLGKNTYWLVFNQNGSNYYALTGLNGYNGTYTVQMALTPLEAYGIDQKIDDALPNSGKVTATRLVTYYINMPATPYSGSACINNPNNVYNTSTSDLANALTCGMIFKW